MYILFLVNIHNDFLGK